MLPAVAYDAFYEPAGDDVFVATPATAGPWGADAQHVGPPSALLARAFERHERVAASRLADRDGAIGQGMQTLVVSQRH